HRVQLNYNLADSKQKSKSDGLNIQNPMPQFLISLQDASASSTLKQPQEVLLKLCVRKISPHFSTRPSSMEVPAGSNVNLTCVAVGAPMPRVQWFDSKGTDLGSNEPGKQQIGRFVLIMLTDVTSDDNYTCQAQNALGTIHWMVSVTVQKMPEPPSDLQIENVPGNEPGDRVRTRVSSLRPHTKYQLKVDSVTANFSSKDNASNPIVEFMTLETSPAATDRPLTVTSSSET
uniref:protein-tyrosine-phosphatase n=1 Tax=Macrostomum lignano TaxID=282301 RepID=A0A1I8FKP7_9PLAT